VDPVESPAPRRFLLLLPDLPVATKRIFEALEPGLPENPRAATIFLEKYQEAVPGAVVPYFNRLEAAAERVVPRLRMIREDAERRFERRFTLTGSGSSYFAEVGTDFPDPSAAWSVAQVPVRARVVRSA
jgi:4-diphosphocytidyl-2C-methyl-D-erythritol kinase